MRFSYFQLSATDFAPIIFLKILGKYDDWLEVDAYIDSGASFSIFSAKHAAILGIDSTKGKLQHVTVGDGGLLAVYLHTLKVHIAGEHISAVIGFSKQLGVGFNLLGRKSFFEYFKICFNDKQRFVELHKV